MLATTGIGTDLDDIRCYLWNYPKFRRTSFDKMNDKTKLNISTKNPTKTTVTLKSNQMFHLQKQAHEAISIFCSSSHIFSRVTVLWLGLDLTIVVKSEQVFVFGNYLWVKNCHNFIRRRFTFSSFPINGFSYVDSLDFYKIFDLGSADDVANLPARDIHFFSTICLSN